MGMHLEGVGAVHFFKVTNVWRAEDKIRTAKISHEIEEDRREKKEKKEKAKKE